MGLARRSSKMKDMSRNTEEDKRISFKEEMFRRAEETRSLMMSRTGLKANNGSENGHVGRTSPTGTEHKSAFKIKIEREGENGGTNGSANEVGQKNYFKVNIEAVSNEKDAKQFQVKNDKEIFMNGEKYERPSTLPRTYRGQVQRAGHNFGFDMSKRPGQQMGFLNNGQIESGKQNPSKNAPINKGLFNPLTIKNEKVIGNTGLNNSDFQKKEFENLKSKGKDSCSPSSKSQTGGTGSKLNGFEMPN